MRNLRSYYSASLAKFLQQSIEEILGTIHANNAMADTTIQQSNTWEQEIAILKEQLSIFDEGQIIFEYTIPRMGKRVDVVFLHNNIVFLLGKRRLSAIFGKMQKISRRDVFAKIAEY